MPRKNGVVLYLLIFILIAISLLILQFNQMARHAGSVTFRFEKTELARQIAESAIDEAFAVVWKETEKIGSPLYQFLFRRDKNSVMTVDTPIMKGYDPGTGDKANIEVTISIIDFSEQDVYGNRFYDGEGVGTFQLCAKVTLKRGSKQVAECQIIRHHDFRICSMITAKATRKPQYAAGFLLDYVLCVRFALQEFKSNPRSYNNANVKLVLDDQDKEIPEKRGKVFFGGTDVKRNIRDEPIFFNVAENEKNYKDAFPKFTPGKFHEIGLDDCCELYPELKKEKKLLKGLKGEFEAEIAPTWREKYEGIAGEKEKLMLRDIKPSLELYQHNLEPGVLHIARSENLKRDPNYAKTILEGAIRQRFLYHVKLTLNLNDVRKIPNDMKERILNDPAYKIPCIPMPKDPNLIDNHNVKTFLTNLAKIDSRYPQPKFPVISRLEDGFLFAANDVEFKRNDSLNKESYPSPEDFINKSGGKMHPFDYEFCPFDHGIMKYRGLDYFSQFINSDQYNFENDELKLRGITYISDNVVLKAKTKKNIEFSGKGVIVANNFQILSGIKKKADAAPDDFCILCTWGGWIYINTSDEIEAGLMAIGGDRGSVIAAKPLKLKGCLVVDYLNLESWCNGEHIIAYNPIFRRTASEGDLFLVLPSPQITFQRITEGGS